MGRPESERVLNRQELEDLKRNLSMLSEHGVEGVYQTAHRDCRFTGGRLPPASAIQQLVTAWRVLRKFRDKR